MAIEPHIVRIDRHEDDDSPCGEPEMRPHNWGCLVLGALAVVEVILMALGVAWLVEHFSK